MISQVMTTHERDGSMTLSFASLRVMLACLTALAVAAGVSANAASAGSYTSSQCRTPDGAAVGAPDMHGSINAPYMYWSIDCVGPSARMGVSFEPTVSHPAGASAELTFVAPANTTIAAVEGNRTSAVSPGSAFRTPVAKIDSS